MDLLATLYNLALEHLLALLGGLPFVGFGLVKGVSSQGTLLYISVDGSPSNFQKIGNVVEFSGPGGQAQVLDASNLESTFREKLMGLPDEGQFTFGINLDADDTVHILLRTARRARTLCEFKLVLPYSTAQNVVFFGYVLGAPIAGGVDQIVKQNLTIEIDGEVLWP
jgi:hypothetical protein